MNVTVDKNVVYEIKDVVIDTVIIQAHRERFTVVVPFRWVDATGKSVRDGSNRYDEAAMIAAIGAPAVAALKALLGADTEGQGSGWLRLNTTITFTRRTRSAQGAWVQAELTEEQVAAAIAPMTITDVRAIVAGMTQAAL